MTTIFTVCAMSVKDGEVKRQRTWGWYFQRDAADVDVMNNATDMFECGYYNMCVIEEYTEGIMTLAINRWWYKATFHVGPGNETTVERVGGPEWAEGSINFGMG